MGFLTTQTIGRESLLAILTEIPELLARVCVVFNHIPICFDFFSPIAVFLLLVVALHPREYALTRQGFLGKNEQTLSDAATADSTQPGTI